MQGAIQAPTSRGRGQPLFLILGPSWPSFRFQFGVRLHVIDLSDLPDLPGLPGWINNNPGGLIRPDHVLDLSYFSVGGAVNEEPRVHIHIHTRHTVMEMNYYP